MYALFKDSKQISPKFFQLSDLWRQIIHRECIRYNRKTATLKEGYTIEEIKGQLCH